MAAAALLVVSTAAVVVALLVGTEQAVGTAAVSAVLLAWVVARLGHDELVDERHAHAEDRVAQASAFRSLFLERSAEHALFASRMRNQVLAADRLNDDLRGILRLAEGRADEAETRARFERSRALAAETRVDELESELAGRRPELIDELAAWEVVPGLEADTVVDLLSWEERTGSKVVEQRRRA